MMSKSVQVNGRLDCAPSRTAREPSPASHPAASEPTLSTEYVPAPDEQIEALVERALTEDHELLRRLA